MPKLGKKSVKKSNIDVANIEIDAGKDVLESLTSVEDMIDLKDKEILGELEVEKPAVSGKKLSF